MNLAIIKYNAGNIQSVITALERLGLSAEVTDDAEKILVADKVIFPGVGEASSAMKSLKQANLHQVIKDLKQPVLGICVGMQLLCNHSEENDTDCLHIVPVKVKKFSSIVLSEPHPGSGHLLQKDKESGNVSVLAELPGVKYKVPQVGWNTIYNLKSNLFTAIPENSYIYNVHSYYAEDSEYTIASCNYGLHYAAAIKKDNFYGVQFHTEKSAGTGDKIIKNFWDIV